MLRPVAAFLPLVLGGTAVGQTPVSGQRVHLLLIHAPELLAKVKEIMAKARAARP